MNQREDFSDYHKASTVEKDKKEAEGKQVRPSSHTFSTSAWGSLLYLAPGIPDTCR